MAKGEIFQGLPSWAKGVIAIAVVGGAGFFIYKLYKKGKSLEENKTSLDETKAAGNEATQLAKAGVKPTLTNSMLTNMVNGIKNAWLEQDIFTRAHVAPFFRELAKVNNDLDMLNLINAYKVQTIDFPWTRFVSSDYTGNLTSSVKHFLNTDEVHQANVMLAKKGIKNRF
jgi:hypothetical protein